MISGSHLSPSCLQNHISKSAESELRQWKTHSICSVSVCFHLLSHAVKMSPLCFLFRSPAKTPEVQCLLLVFFCVFVGVFCGGFLPSGSRCKMHSVSPLTLQGHTKHADWEIMRHDRGGQKERRWGGGGSAKTSVWQKSTSQREREKRKKSGTNGGMSERKEDHRLRSRKHFLFIYFLHKAWMYRKSVKQPAGPQSLSSVSEPVSATATETATSLQQLPTNVWSVIKYAGVTTSCCPCICGGLAH